MIKRSMDQEAIEKLRFDWVNIFFFQFLVCFFSEMHFNKASENLG